jgi:hypothetical protein
MMRNCPRCLNTTVIEDGYCGHCRECTLAPENGSGAFTVETIKGRNWKRPKFQAVRVGDRVVLATERTENRAVAVALEKQKLQAKCSHKFIDSNHCLKCGWVPPNDKVTDPAK